MSFRFPLSPRYPSHPLAHLPSLYGRTATTHSKKGYLHKKSSKGKHQKRWFKTSTRHLVYYSSDKEEQALKAAALDVATLTIAILDADDCSFALRGGEGGDLILRAGSAKEAARWARKLGDRLNRLREGAAPGAGASQAGGAESALGAARTHVDSLLSGSAAPALQHVMMGPLKVKLRGALGTHPWETRFFAVEEAVSRRRSKRSRRRQQSDSDAPAMALRWYRKREHMEASNDLRMGARKSTLSLSDIASAAAGGSGASNTGASALDRGGVDGELMLESATMTVVMGGAHHFLFEVSTTGESGTDETPGRGATILQLRAASAPNLRAWGDALKQCGVPSERRNKTALTRAQTQAALPSTSNAVAMAIQTVAGNAMGTTAQSPQDPASPEQSSERSYSESPQQLVGGSAFDPAADRTPASELEEHDEARKSLRGVDYTEVEDVGDSEDSEDEKSGGGGGVTAAGAAAAAALRAMTRGFSDDESEDDKNGKAPSSVATFTGLSPGPAPPFAGLAGAAALVPGATPQRTPSRARKSSGRRRRSKKSPRRNSISNEKWDELSSGLADHVARRSAAEKDEGDDVFDADVSFGMRPGSVPPKRGRRGTTLGKQRWQQSVSKVLSVNSNRPRSGTRGTLASGLAATRTTLAPMNLIKGVKGLGKNLGGGGDDPSDGDDVVSLVELDALHAQAHVAEIDDPRLSFCGYLGKRRPKTQMAGKASALVSTPNTWQRRWFRIAPVKDPTTDAMTLALQWYASEEDVESGEMKNQALLKEMDPDYGMKLSYSSERIDGVKTLMRKHTKMAMSAMMTLGAGGGDDDDDDEGDDDVGESRARLVILLGDQQELKVKALGSGTSAHSIENWYRAIFFCHSCLSSGTFMRLEEEQELQRIEEQKSWLDLFMELEVDEKMVKVIGSFEAHFDDVDDINREWNKEALDQLVEAALDPEDGIFADLIECAAEFRKEAAQARKAYHWEKSEADSEDPGSPFIDDGLYHYVKWYHMLFVTKMTPWYSRSAAASRSEWAMSGRDHCRIYELDHNDVLSLIMVMVGHIDVVRKCLEGLDALSERLAPELDMAKLNADLEFVMGLYTDTTNSRLRFMTNNLFKRLENELAAPDEERDPNFVLTDTLDGADGGQRIYTHAPDDLFMLMTTSLDAALRAEKAHALHAKVLRVIVHRIERYQRYVVSLLHRHKISTLSDERICVALVNDCEALQKRLTMVLELDSVEAAVEVDGGAEDCVLDLQRNLRTQCATKAIDTLVEDIFAQPTIAELFRTLFDERGGKRVRGAGVANSARRNKLKAALRLVCGELRALRPLLGEIYFFRLLLPAAVDHATVSFFRAMYDQASSVKTALRKFLLNSDDREGVRMDFEIVKEQLKQLIDVGEGSAGAAPTAFEQRQMVKAQGTLQRKFDSQIFNDFCGLLTRDPAYLFTLVRKIVNRHPTAVHSILLAVQLCLAVRDDLTKMKKAAKASILESCEREALNEVAKQFAAATSASARSRGSSSFDGGDPESHKVRFVLCVCVCVLPLLKPDPFSLSLSPLTPSALLFTPTHRYRATSPHPLSADSASRATLSYLAQRTTSYFRSRTASCRRQSCARSHFTTLPQRLSAY